MGCDIHMNVEVRRRGRWQFVPPTEESKYVPGYRHWWNDRSYITFAVLAGVRADNGDPPPISEPRGYPEDADPVTVLDEPNEDGLTSQGQNHGDHSHTWLTLDEVLAYDWSVAFQETGVVSIVEYVRCLREKDTPNSWSRWGRWVGGGQTKVLTPSEADLWLKSEEASAALLDAVVNDDSPFAREFGGHLYVDWAWTTLLNDRCASFLEWARSLPKMLRAAPENIRLVFSFDS